MVNIHLPAWGAAIALMGNYESASWSLMVQICVYENNYDFQAGQRMGWTGFTWDKHLFPDPKMFLDWYNYA